MNQGDGVSHSDATRAATPASAHTLSRARKLANGTGHDRTRELGSGGAGQWSEWAAMLLHEAPQTPEWQDGRRPGALPEAQEDVLLQVPPTAPTAENG